MYEVTVAFFSLSLVFLFLLLARIGSFFASEQPLDWVLVPMAMGHFKHVALGRCHQQKAGGVLCRSWIGWIRDAQRMGTINIKMALRLTSLTTYRAWLIKKFSFMCGMSPILPQMEGASGLMEKKKSGLLTSRMCRPSSFLTRFKPITPRLISAVSFDDADDDAELGCVAMKKDDVR